MDSRASNTSAPDRATLNLIRTIDGLSEPLHRVGALLRAADRTPDERDIAHLHEMAIDEIMRAEHVLLDHVKGVAHA